MEISLKESSGEIKPKYYKDLLGLYFSEPNAPECQYVQAFSFQKDLLRNLTYINVPISEIKYYSIKPIKSFSLILPMEETNLELNIINLNQLKNIEDNIYNENLILYGFNYIDENNYICEQVLLQTEKKHNYLEKNGQSHNQIKINTFYKESILNA